jgi:hypothetical protein
MACAAQDDASMVCGDSVHFTLGLARIRHRRHPELADAVKLHQPMGIPLAQDLYLFGVDLLALWLWQYSNIAGGLAVVALDPRLQHPERRAQGDGDNREVLRHAAAGSSPASTICVWRSPRSTCCRPGCDRWKSRKPEAE